MHRGQRRGVWAALAANGGPSWASPASMIDHGSGGVGLRENENGSQANPAVKLGRCRGDFCQVHALRCSNLPFCKKPADVLTTGLSCYSVILMLRYAFSHDST